MEAAPVNLSAYWRLLRGNRNFRLLWSAQFISEIGDWLYMVAIQSLILELTGSAQAVAFAFVLQVLPQTLTAPAAGILNDRLSRRSVMLFADWSRAAVTLCMMFAQTRELLPVLYVLLFLETVNWALFEPARTAVIPNITTPEQNLVANGLSATTWSFTLAIGSAVGGVLAAFFGRDTVFILNSLSFVLSAMFIRRMRFTEPHTTDLPRLRPRDLFDYSPLVEGMRYVRKDPRLLATMFVKSGISFMGVNWVLIPVFGSKVFPIQGFGLSPAQGVMLSISLLMGCRGVGALIGPFAASHFTGGSPRRLRLGILAAFGLGCAGYLCLSQAPTLALACASIVLAHSGGSIAWVYSTTLLQRFTEDRFRGRVFSAEYAMSMGILAINVYIAGVLNDQGVPVRTLAIITACMILIPALLWSLALVRIFRKGSG